MEQQQQQQQAFTFASPISLSNTHEDALDFDYQSWIEQSKMSNRFSSQGHTLAEAINTNHREMLHDEETYEEMSLRDLSELSLSRVATQEAANSSARQKKPRRNKSPSMKRVGLIIKLFVPLLSRPAVAAPERKKNFACSTVTASGNGGSVQNAISEAGNGTSNTQCNSMPIKSYKDCTNRKSVVCYPLFNSRKYKVKHVAGYHFCP
ncbi:hypothetical protein PR202_ga18459 [Eleusine coracana subsp. coracana]|uniref:Uncharacterized protein n=1 Tax=Eleusine coracana subsp. coracana TaxID=191504 RepID=A0AAV5CTK1_ELECO|nr:hypothetical protein QOZ80_4AG0298110 [Eleusine coracana subsp. coracana]GJN01212.1 hypothetical protein PR202_ga18459 [Eleusine coracana subsp. coracana]